MQNYTLETICDIKSGGTPSRTDQANYGGNIFWAKISDIEACNGTLNFTEETISEKGLKAIRNRVFKKGTLLFAMYGSVGKMAFAGKDLTTNQAILGIEIKDKEMLFDRYLYYWLFKQKEQLLTQANGVTQKNLSATFVRNLEIPLPSLEEQKRIAAILDKADAIRRKRKEAIALTEELLRSTFLDMFGDPVTNPKGWDIMPMSDVISQIEAGWSAKAEERQRDIDEWGVLKISAVTSGVFNPKEHKAVNNPTFLKNPIIPKKGDLLFSRANTRELVAATCLVESDCEKVFLPDKLWRIKTNPEVANVEYLRFLLAHPRYRSLLARKATGTSGSMLNVSQAKLLSMNAPVPNINIQIKFAKILWHIYKLKERAEKSFETLNINFNSLLQKAFRGEL